MKEFEVNGVQYMAVEVPSNSVVFELECRLGFSEREIWLICHDKVGIVKQGYKVGVGTWEIVGLVRELTKLNTFSHCEEETEDPVNGCLCHGDGLGDCRAVINNRVMEGFNKIVEKHNLNDNSLIIKKI